ncbi:MAG TPA: hypothetical protein VGW12_05190 [Pyrinomonadaceae bacterium]|nr:hypothetical protein [Pyrinomonadaceae bacterium]
MANSWNVSWLDRNTIILDNKPLVFILGFLASSLLMIAGADERKLAMMFFFVFVLLLILIFALVRHQDSERLKFRERKLLQSRLGAVSLAALGFGVGDLVYRYRHWFAWLWYKLRKIDKPDEWVLVSLFLLGVMLGFFVVRNWSKDQKEFLNSLTAIFGAAFFSTILGQLTNQTGSVVTPQNTFSFYALGFALSGGLNLFAFALLIAHYTRTRALWSRSVIDFLYGSDKAEAIDTYFLKNFEADPNYAKAKLVAALRAYRDIIRIEFARKLDYRKDASGRVDLNTGALTLLATDSPPVEPDSPPAPAPTAQAFDYFELLSIKSTPGETELDSPPVPAPGSYEILFRKLRAKQPGEHGEPITPEMFRVAISMRWLDNIEYVVTAGEYLNSFPYYGSVAGMSLLIKRPIVMNRDKYRKFRTSAFPQGKTPSQADQPRGLYEIDYLSYITIPMSSSLGTPDEQALGVLHLDTKLFACPKGQLPADADKLEGADAQSEIYRIFIKRDDQQQLDKELDRRLDEFEAYASNLYPQNDPLIEDLVKMKDVIIPLLELYKKCRTGATRQATTTTTTTTTAA